MRICAVVPHAGTWIEISLQCSSRLSPYVVPHAGTWIEIGVILSRSEENSVVPHAGTWIEILDQDVASRNRYRRSPRGNVD